MPTKPPLAIYSPPTRYLDWQLSRHEHLKWVYDRRLAADQAGLPRPVSPTTGREFTSVSTVR